MNHMVERYCHFLHFLLKSKHSLKKNRQLVKVAREKLSCAKGQEWRIILVYVCRL